MVFISFLVYLVVLSAAEEKELKSSRIIVDLSISFFFYGFSLTYFAVLFLAHVYLELQSSLQTDVTWQKGSQRALWGGCDKALFQVRAPPL